MKIALTDQRTQLPALLPAFKRLPLSYHDYTLFPARQTARLVPTAQPIMDLRTCNLDFLFDYAIFPPLILTACTEWQLDQRPMQVGDVIVQQVRLPPLALALKCIFAVQVLAITRTATRMSFHYGTLVGHAETGVSEFAFVLHGHELYALIHTFSQPGTLLSRLVAPVFTLPYQQYCTNRALDQMRDGFVRANPESQTP